MNDINFTFGIITDASKEVNPHLLKAIQSIRELHVPEYEIIIVGEEGKLRKHEYLNDNNPRVKFINFDETKKLGWITKKKNLITKSARYENIVYQHDYIIHCSNWYNGFKVYGDNFDACMVQIKNADGNRFRDWVIFPWHLCHGGRLINETKKLWESANITNNESLLPYDESRFAHLQYFSGSYWIAKKQTMLNIPLDENLAHDQGEDCDWSLRFTSKYKFSMNQFSTVQFLKQKNDAFNLMNQDSYMLACNFIQNK